MDRKATPQTVLIGDLEKEELGVLSLDRFKQLVQLLWLSILIIHAILLVQVFLFVRQQLLRHILQMLLALVPVDFLLLLPRQNVGILLNLLLNQVVQPLVVDNELRVLPQLGLVYLV